VDRSRSPENAYDIVQAIVDFVNDVMNETPYTRDEMPARAMQAYHADLYLAQVKNGGHSQFIHNIDDNLANVVADTRAALAEMKADRHLAILERMVEWVRDNPAEASRQSGFEGGRSPFLDKLDMALYEADDADPMIDLSAKWILSWPELRIVDDADYREAIGQTALMSPAREARLVQRSIAEITHQLTDPFHAGAGLACAATSEIKLAVGAGQSWEIEGKEQLAFDVLTNAGTRLYVPTDRHAAVYERIQADNPPMPDFRDTGEVTAAFTDGRFANYKLPTVGARLSQVTRKGIEDVIQFAVEHKTGAAIDILLRRAGLEPAGAAVSPVAVKPSDNGDGLHCLIAIGGQVLLVNSTGQGALVINTADDRTLAVVRRDEVDEHAARSEAAFGTSAALG
jgi:hypothetical protein